MAYERRKAFSLPHRRFDSRVLLQFFVLFFGSFVVGLLFIHSSIVYYRSIASKKDDGTSTKAWPEPILQPNTQAGPIEESWSQNATGVSSLVPNSTIWHTKRRRLY